METEKGSFSRAELQQGWRLSCQTKVKEDIAIQVEESLLSVQEFTGTVTSNENVATFIKELIIETPEPIDYRSGGYLQFHVPPYRTHTTDWKKSIDPLYYPDWERFGMFDCTIDSHQEVIRAYSMASYPAEGTTLRFNIRIATPPIVKGKLASIPWGICSSYTFGLKPGDQVTLSGPYGESFMIDSDQEVVFLIGGAGSSFARSHILHLFYTQKTNRIVSLWYGARSLKENIYQKEYEDLAEQAPNFSYHLVLSEPSPQDLEQGWLQDPVHTNFLFRAFELGQLKTMEEPEEALYYVCGPPLHNTSVLQLLDEYGVSNDHIVLDDFGS